MSSVPFLFIVAVLAWGAVLLIPGPYKYKVGDCIGIAGTPIAQVADRQHGVYTVDLEVWLHESRKPLVAWRQEVVESCTDLVKCPDRKWRKP